MVDFDYSQALGDDMTADVYWEQKPSIQIGFDLLKCLVHCDMQEQLVIRFKRIRFYKKMRFSPQNRLNVVIIREYLSFSLLPY